MGSYMRLIKSKGAHIPQEKREEFAQRVFELFDRGGMMKWSQFSLLGSTYEVLRRLSPEEKSYFFSYNYFQDDFMEDAGFNGEEYRVWSNKVGGRQFGMVMASAYALEGAYTNGITAIDDNTHIIRADFFLHWVNYLFNEEYYAKNRDPWATYLVAKEIGLDLEADDFWFVSSSEIGVIGVIDIIAVTEGIDALKDYLKDGIYENEYGFISNLRKRIGRSFNSICELLTEYKNSNPLPKDEQLDFLTSFIRHVYHTDKTVENNTDYIKFNMKQLEDEIKKSNLLGAIAKVIAELYSIDFWEIWTKIEDVAYRTDYRDKKSEHAELFPMSTEKFFSVSSDDLVLYWKQDKPIKFSDEMEKWLDGLKEAYARITTDGVDMQSPLRRIKNIIDFGESHYYKLLLFEDFINETMDNIADKRFMALWTVFDEVLHDPENLEAAKVVIEQVEWDSLANEYRCAKWWRMSDEFKFNKGRRAMRRFVALMANKELRNKVFGF